MNRDDMKTRGLKEQQVVNLKSEFKGVVREAHNFKVVGLRYS